MSDLTNADLEGISYEEALGELERIVATLESEERPLEDALALYERGQSLARYCASLLDKAELKVQQLSGEELQEFQP
jgi:exodeoxyribonuclease VII small subunit